MIKKLLLCMVLVASVGTASAQKSLIKANSLLAKQQKEKMEKKVDAKVAGGIKASTTSNQWISKFGSPVSIPSASMSKAPLKAEEEATYTWFDYNYDAYYLNFLTLATDSYNLAVYVPSNYAGCTIEQLAVYFYDPSRCSNLKFWILDADATAMPTTAEDADVYYSVDEITTSGYTYCVLDESYTIGQDGCLIGYTFDHNYVGDGDYADYPINLYYVSDVSGGFYYYYPGEGWYSGYGSGYGNLTIAAYMDVSSMSPYQASVGSIGEYTVMADEENSVDTYVTNDAYGEITQISYILTVDGEAGAETDYSVDIAAQSYEYIYVPYTFDEGIHTVELEITKVNGEENVSTSNTATGTIVSLATKADRVSVVEEFTSTSCGYCPRGHVGLANLKDAYGDKIVTLAGHYPYSYTDPMYCDDYYYTIYYYSNGFPSAAFNRSYIGDPYHGISSDYSYGADYLVDALDEIYPAEASLDMTAAWADDDCTSIDVDVTTTFTIERLDAPYALAFILAEDDMADPDESTSVNTWWQLNYYPSYASYYTDDDMSYWVTASNAKLYGSYYYNSISYDNVIVATWGDASYGDLLGVSGSIDECNPDYPAEYSTTLSISGNDLIQDKSKLNLVAILINQNNGMITNATQVKLPTTDGIKTISGTVSESDAEVARYNTNGMKISAPQKGINIVKLANGKTKKVVVE